MSADAWKSATFTTARRYVGREATTHGRRRSRVTNLCLSQSGCATDRIFRQHPSRASVFSPRLMPCSNVCYLNSRTKANISRRFPGRFFYRVYVTHPPQTGPTADHALAEFHLQLDGAKLVHVDADEHPTQRFLLRIACLQLDTTGGFRKLVLSVLEPWC